MDNINFEDTTREKRWKMIYRQIRGDVENEYGKLSVSAGNKKITINLHPSIIA